MKDQSRKTIESQKGPNIIPIFKKDKKKDLENYRPGSFTSIPWEYDRVDIFKHMYYKKLIKFSQHGFTKEKSLLSLLIAFCNEMSSLVPGERLVSVVYPFFKRITHTSIISFSTNW